MPSCHRANSPSWSRRVIEAELRRASCHRGVLARTYIVGIIGESLPSINAARASTVVSDLTISRAKAKGSVDSELMACLTAHAEVYPASLTWPRIRAV